MKTTEYKNFKLDKIEKQMEKCRIRSKKMEEKNLNSILSFKVFIFIVLLVCHSFPIINAFTHWVVTEEGKIEAQVSFYSFI